MWPSDWPAVPRAIATATDAAVRAARAADAAAVRAALDDLAELPAEQVGVVLAAMVREQLEIAHPDGLDGDDVRAVLEPAVRGAAWLPELEAAAFVAALTGALGVSGSDESPPPPRALQAAGVVLTARLCGATGVPATDSLRRALAEIARAETVEMP
ncbi:hypothetical protein ACWEVD_26615 [Nocardia thailandica]